MSIAPCPVAAQKQICIGIDVGKKSHVAGFLSPSLLTKFQRFEKCPTLKFENRRVGFEKLLAAMKEKSPLAGIAVVVESTGHYHRPLLDFLQEHDIECYIIHVQKRLTETKTDERDALHLANLLYNQVALGVQYTEKHLIARHVQPATEEAVSLRYLVRHRYELQREITRHKNKLIAVCDELFPEFVEILKDPTVPTALAIRERFPTSAAIAAADIAVLKACRAWRRPSLKELLRLKELAKTSIGCKEPGRIHGLCIEQQQLIVEIRIFQQHLEQLDTEIIKIVEGTREGKILTSIQGINTIHAGQILACMGNIANFEKASELRRYFGWSPAKEQSGTTLDKTALTRGGSRIMRQAMWLAVLAAVRYDSEWKSLYERLVPRLCTYDIRKKKYVGKNRVITRIAAQMINVIFTLLWKDHKLLASLPVGEEPPTPALYDREIHRSMMNRR